MRVYQLTESQYQQLLADLKFQEMATILGLKSAAAPDQWQIDAVEAIHRRFVYRVVTALTGE